MAENTYKNPIIFGDYADPDIIRHGDDFYMVSSSFLRIPGLPVLHSKDLINWRLAGYALHELPDQCKRRGGFLGSGVWAPSIRYHNGVFHEQKLAFSFLGSLKLAHGAGVRLFKAE